ncbi:hypothetical protein QYE76_002204 [Lolium multiflorum]|uniref:CCHC-type domain-containing protein n=1 Tax=Lolium multiflorum TaxID=4521 RepID=A0AAD8VZB4_LOLMU|nr:hypothetical protein QYE76_002204 [Lolium multiflorum]
MSATSDAQSGTSGGSKGKGTKTIDEMLGQLDLQEEDFRDVCLDDVEEEINESTQWLALARVKTERGFSQAVFYGEMRAAWNLAQEVRFRAIGQNLFVVQVQCLGDWERIMERGPWIFQNQAVLLEPYDGFSRAQDIELFFMPIWAQIHELPEAYCKEKVVKQLIEKAGEKAMEVKITGNWGNYVRVRIRYDVRKPLLRFVSFIKDGKRHVFALRYEKLAGFCPVCGLLGHEYKECGRGVYEEKDHKYRDWLYANPPRPLVRGEYGGARGGRGNRGRGPGRGRDSGIPGGRGRTEEENEELKDTGTSPHKTADMVIDKVGEIGARKRINMDGQESGKEGLLMLTDENTIGAMEEEENDSTSVDSQGNKGAKKTGNSEVNPNEILAGSLEGCP